MTRKRIDDTYRNSIEPPIYQNASYYFDNAEHVVAGMHDKTTKAGRYGRYSNPTWIEVEGRLSEINRSEDSLLFASGMAAHFTSFISFLKAGDEVLLPTESYRQVRNLFHVVLPRMGIVVHEFSIQDPDAFYERVIELRDKLALVHLEMPSSPHMFLVDIAKIKSALKAETIVTMDSSFAPPPNFYAVEWGIDLAIFSATKYLNGHGDIMAGVVSGRADLVDKVRWHRDTTGGIIDGVVANTLKRSLYTLDLRMERVNRSGLLVAEFLEEHERIAKVYYTGLDSHPHRGLAQKYLHGHGGVVTFELGLSEDATSEFVDSLEVPFMASNFGAPHTLVEQSTFFTYFEYTDEQLKTIGVDKSTVRLAIGFTQNVEDIIRDLDRAIENVP